MTRHQTDTFLSEVRNAVIATNRYDGAPQLSTVWYLYEHGLIYVGFEAKSAKHRNIMRDQRVSMCVGGEHPDSRTVTIYGTAEYIDKGDPRFKDVTSRIHVRYSKTEEDAQHRLGTAQSNIERMLIVINPDKILARDYN
jgi:PPOX class probable F420-dependent enzyme